LRRGLKKQLSVDYTQWRKSNEKVGWGQNLTI